MLKIEETADFEIIPIFVRINEIDKHCMHDDGEEYRDIKSKRNRHNPTTVGEMEYDIKDKIKNCHYYRGYHCGLDVVFDSRLEISGKKDRF